MDQIQQYAKTYQEYKRELDTELSKTAEGFVRIGYLLKVARDTDVLAQSPYQTVTEFAKAEYGIDKTMVSRFISINDRFSEGGYSDQLLEQYRGYGYAKLTLMLSLPDEINRELSPAYSKSEIQAIKDEVDAENAITDLEVMMEAGPEQAGKQALEEKLLNSLVHQLGEDSPELYVQMAQIVALEGAEWIRAAKETMAPNGEKQYSIRISGIGRYLVSIRDTEDTITATSLRTMEQRTYDYTTLMEAWEEILPPTNGKMDTAWTEKDCMMSWELTYDREYPGKAEVAPVQHPTKPGKTESKPAPRKESKVQKAPKPKPMGKEPGQEIKSPAPEMERPESTSTEPVPEKTKQEPLKAEQTAPETEQTAPKTEQVPQEAERPALEPEKPEKTGTDGISEPEIEFAPGMRIRNKVGNPHFPVTPGTILGRHWSVPAWNARFDGLDMTKIIFDIDMKEFEVLKEEPNEAGDQTPENQGEEQLPGQVELEEAIAEAAERASKKTGEEKLAPEAVQETAEELDLQWSRIKNTINGYMESASLNKRLYNIFPAALRTTRTDLFKMTEVIEKELRRRGERF